MTLRKNHNIPRDKKLKLIDFLVARARNGSVRSLNILLVLFDPLILKISNRIYHRTHGNVQVDELHESGKCEFMRLTLMNYTPGGAAKYNRYIESHVHAELWKMYRHVVRHIATDQDKLDTIAITTPAYVSDGTAEAIAAYSMVNLSSAEKHVIKECVMGNTLASNVAREMGISSVRVSHIKTHALAKMRHMMYELGITEADAKY